jgi:hypothetical protein
LLGEAKFTSLAHACGISFSFISSFLYSAFLAGSISACPGNRLSPVTGEEDGGGENKEKEKNWLGGEEENGEAML